MKIALLSASFRGGGAERVQITLAGEFARLGHQVHFVAFEDDGPLRGDIPDGVELTVFGVPRVSRGIRPLTRFLKDTDPDVVIAAMVHVGTVALAAQILSGWKGKVLVRADGSRRYHGRKAGGRRLGPRQTPADPSAQGTRPYRSILLHHQGVQGGPGAEELSCHPQSCICQVRRQRPGEASLFRQRGPGGDRYRKTHEAEGLLLSHRSICRPDTSSRAETYHTRGRRAAAGLENRISELGLGYRVSLPGFVPDPYPYLERSSVFVLSSESEPFGLTLVEALSTGIPVVSTDTEGPRDILNDKRLGYMISFGEHKRFGPRSSRPLISRRVSPGQEREGLGI